MFVHKRALRACSQVLDLLLFVDEMASAKLYLRGALPNSRIF